MKNIFLRGFYAFTLAEVLITLGVLGIVAAMTLPTLIGTYKKNAYITQIIKSVSQFDQAMQNIMVRRECTDMVCTTVFSDVSDSNVWNDMIDTEIKKSIKVIFSFKSGQKANNNLKSTYLSPRGTYTSNMDWNDSTGYKFITPDGVMYVIKSRGCMKTPFAESSIIKNYCADVTIDINGERPPNQYGRDIHNFMLAQNGHIYPLYDSGYAIAMSGGDETSSDSYWKNNDEACASDKYLHQVSGTVKGSGCAARIIESGWKMNY